MIVNFLFKKFKININNHFIWCHYEDWKRFGFLMKILTFFKSDYIRCLIFRKKYKGKKNLVILGLNNPSKNKMKRRTSGFAKKWLIGRKEPRCLYCGTILDDLNATTDHIIPISKGGNNSQVNLVVCCKDCNSKRGNLDFFKFYKGKRKFI